MNIRLVVKLLGSVCIALGLAMAFSIPWAFERTPKGLAYEREGTFGLLMSMSICFLCGGLLRAFGQKAKPLLFRREAIAVVVFSWVLATLLGALPYVLSGTARAKHVSEEGETILVKMTIFDAMFESQSGFSTTGATVLSDVENPEMIPRCILFWRGCTHFLGGIGIIVLLVAILGQGLGGKEVLRAERGGSPGEGSPLARVQSLAWSLFGIYVVLNVVLIFILLFLKLSPFDAICHAFSAMSTGGFSTHNLSVGYFATDPKYDSAAIEWVLILFMFLGGTNFVLFFWCLCGQPGRLFRDVEWRTYFGLVLAASVAITAFGFWYGSFDLYGMLNPPPVVADVSDSALPPDVDGSGVPDDPKVPVSYAFRTSMFHVVSLMTTTGFVADQYDRWNPPAVVILLFVMFTGACAGSTAGGVKLFRLVLGAKIVRAQIEHTYHPTVVRNIWLQKNVVNRDLLNSVAVYIALYFFVIVAMTLVVVTLEPDATWLNKGYAQDRQLLDAPSMVLTCLSNVGPGVGVIGADGNFGVFSSATKFVLTWIMLLGRLEIFVVLAVFSPRFWRPHA